MDRTKAILEVRSVAGARSRLVAIARFEGNVEAAVRAAVGLAGGFPDVAGKRVVVKPNLVYLARSGSGVVTDARVTEAVGRIALAAGARELTIAEGSATGAVWPTEHFDTLEVAEVSGHLAAAERLGARFVCAQHGR